MEDFNSWPGRKCTPAFSFTHKKSDVKFMASLIGLYGGVLLLLHSHIVNIDVGVHDFQRTGAAKRLFYLSYHTHFGITVDLQHDKHLCLVCLIELLAFLCDEVLDIIYLLERIVELDLRFAAVECLEGLERLTYVDKAGERFFLEYFAFSGIGDPDGDHDVCLAHRGDCHEEEEYHEDYVRQR